MLISYLETLSVTQLDRQEASLTWMAYVSLKRHAFMYAAPFAYCRSVTAESATPAASLSDLIFSLLKGFFFLFSEFLSLFLLIPNPLPSVIFPPVTLPHSSFTYMMSQTAHELEFNSSVMHLLHFDQTWLLSARPRHSLELPPDMRPLR